MFMVHRHNLSFETLCDINEDFSFLFFYFILFYFFFFWGGSLPRFGGVALSSSVFTIWCHILI